MTNNSDELQVRVKQLESDLSASRYVKRDLQDKLDRRDQKMKEDEQHIKTLELVESRLRDQVAGLRDQLEGLKQNLQTAP